MDKLEKSIISTLAYASTKSWPMSLWEIYRYLINPNRFDGRINLNKFDGRINPNRFDDRGAVVEGVSLGNIQKSLGALKKEDVIIEEDGFYSLRRENLAQTRIKRDKISDLKTKKTLKKAYFLAHFPFIRGVFFSGSLAFGWSKEESDIDVLIVTKHGKIWTARIIISIVLLLVGLKRTKNRVKNRICLNHFISEKELKVPLYSLYNAKTYTRLIPIYARPRVARDFVKNNDWVRDYVINGFGSYYCDSRTKQRSYVLRLGQIFTESLISIAGLGPVLEKILKYLQTKRIKKDPLTYEKGGRIVIGDDQIELHPESPEKEMIVGYNKTLKRLDLFSFELEQDSGLRR